MVQELLYTCGVCNASFKSYQEAQSHEAIPIVNAGLPKGLVLVERTAPNTAQRVYIIGESQGIAPFNHEHFYWALCKFWKITDSDLKDPFRLREEILPSTISTDLESAVLTDQELARMKDDFVTKSDDLRLIKVSLNDLTNKLG